MSGLARDRYKASLSAVCVQNRGAWATINDWLVRDEGAHAKVVEIVLLEGDPKCRKWIGRYAVLDRFTKRVPRLSNRG